MLALNTEEKLITAVRKLKELKTVRRDPITVFFTDVVADKQTLPVGFDGWDLFKEPHMLFEQEKYYWFRAKFTAAPRGAEEKVCLSVETFIENVACTIRPQGLLYLNGKLIQGIDINHSRVRVEAGEYEMYLLLYTHTFERALPLSFSLEYVDARTEKLYYDLCAPLDALRILDKKTNEYILSATVLERAVNLIDFREEYSERFYRSAENAILYLKKKLL